MSRFVLSIVTTLAFSVGMAFAQTSSPGMQGTQRSEPGMNQQQQPGQPGMNQPGANPQMTPSDQNNPSGSNTAEKSEKKLKGCVQSEGGQYSLETRKGKEVALTGQDVSAHAGHEVELKGNWESGGNSGMSQSSSGAASGKTFNVTDVKMISDSCSGKSKGSNSGMGSGTGMGSGAGDNGSGAGTGTGTGSGTGTGTGNSGSGSSSNPTQPQ